MNFPVDSKTGYNVIYISSVELMKNLVHKLLETAVKLTPEQLYETKLSYKVI